MRDVIIFVGPTLPIVEAEKHLDAQYLPPASRGDVYRAAQQKPWGIGIIDGYFAQEPAVWHKEILWAMAQGVHVFGAASMGALRAAELSAFGMCGVGEIFESYRDGRCEDDDEVTVLHAPKSSGYRLLSEAMVNIRATLRRAVAEQVISSPTQRHLESIAKATFYADRSFPALLAHARGQGGDEGELDRLQRWLPEHKVNQKQLDAVDMLEFMRERREQSPSPLQVNFRLARTDAWDQMVQQCGEPESPTAGDELSAELILDELRLLGGPALRSALLGALARHLSIERARSQGVTTTRELFSDTINGFFGERGLRSPEQIQRWLEEHGLDAEGLTRFMQQQSLVRWASVMFDPAVGQQLRDHLRTTPDYGRVVRRAVDKQRVLAPLSESVFPQRPDLTESELIRWFFESRLQLAVPTDLDACAWERGFPDRHALLEALQREYAYVAAVEAEGGQICSR